VPKRNPLSLLWMTNKLVPVDIVRTRPRFEGESSHWLGIRMRMDNPWLIGYGAWGWEWEWEFTYLSRSRPHTSHNTRLIHISIRILIIYIITYFLFFISSNCWFFHEIHSHLQYILCSIDVYQLNIFYVSHLSIYIYF